MGRRPDGFFALFKPPGISSAKALCAVKGILQADRAGFLGTLDVFAMGVLPVAVGIATRLIPFLPASTKEYVGELILGISTVTDDMEGEPTERRGAQELSDEAVYRAIETVAAQTEQVPPHVSAKRRDGIRGYNAVRGEGRLIEFSPVPANVYHFELLRSTKDSDLRRITFRMVVTPGFYVRGFCRDVGAVLGCGGCMGRLLRTGAHGFRISDALSLSILRQRVHMEDFAFLSPGDESPALLGTMPHVYLDSAQWADFCHGLAIDCCSAQAGTTVLITRPDGRLGGVAEIRGNKAFPLKVFAT